MRLGLDPLSSAFSRIISAGILLCQATVFIVWPYFLHSIFCTVYTLPVLVGYCCHIATWLVYIVILPLYILHYTTARGVSPTYLGLRFPLFLFA
jgi:hypothetical protein